MSAELKQKAAAFWDDIQARRGRYQTRPPCARFVELHGATVLEPTAFEPDPVTYRGEYYYNAVTNRIYKRVVSRNDKSTGIIVAHWQSVNSL